MAKKKLFEDITADPGRYYRQPGDVARDRRFGDAERLEILQAWALGLMRPGSSKYRRPSPMSGGG